VIDDRNIWAAALAIVKRYGDDAAEGADQLLEDGDPVADANWHRIFGATASAARTHSLGDQARQSLAIKAPDARFCLARFPQFLAISFDRAAPELDIPSCSRACRRHYSPARANNLGHVSPPTRGGRAPTIC
jgi:hypothetical protein